MVILPICHFTATFAHSTLWAWNVFHMAPTQIRCISLRHLHTSMVFQLIKQLVPARTGMAFPFPFLAALYARETGRALLLVWEALAVA